MSAQHHGDPWTLVHRTRRRPRTANPSNIPPLLGLRFGPTHEVRRSYASVADPRSRVLYRRDPSPSCRPAPTRSRRDWSPPNPYRRAPLPQLRVYHPAPSPHRVARSSRGANARPTHRPVAGHRDAPRPRHHQVPRPNDPRSRASPPSPRPVALKTATRPGPSGLAPVHGGPQVPDAPCSSDPDFALKNRVILAAIKAAHHLARYSDPEPPAFISRLAGTLTTTIRPAVPNATTMALIDGNARNWEYNTTTNLIDHYKATVTNKLRVLSQLADPSWRRNFDIASSWAARHFGRRLQQDALEDLRTRIRHQLEVSDPTDDLPLLSGVLPLPLSPALPT